MDIAAYCFLSMFARMEIKNKVLYNASDVSRVDLICNSKFSKLQRRGGNVWVNQSILHTIGKQFYHYTVHLFYF